MNRNEELKQLLESMEKDVPELGGSIVKAYKRRRSKRAVYHSLAGVAVICSLFVLLVNIYEPFAQLCAQTPVLKMLAAAVTVDYSWPDEVKDGEQEKNKEISVLLNQYIEASVESVTVKGMTVEIAYRINSPAYDNMMAWTYGIGFAPSDTFVVDNGGVHTVTIDYSIKDAMAGSVTLVLNVQFEQSTIYDPEMYELAQNVATFYLEVDLHHDVNPKNGVVYADYSDVESVYRIYPMNHLIDMDGQRIMLTHATMKDDELTVYAAQAHSNTSKIVDIFAYTRAADGKLSELSANDAFILLDTNALRSANDRVNSYKREKFADIGADTMELIVDGVRMLDQNRERVYVNLATGETGQLPDGVEVHKIYRRDGTWVVVMRAACRISRDETVSPQNFDIMSTSFYDEKGKQYYSDSRRGYFQDFYRGTGYTHIQVLELTDYPYDEVWIDMAFSHLWEPENEMIFTFAR